MQIFRLETIDGEGFYANRASGSVVKMDHERHPLPERDSLLVKNIGDASIGRLHFGFSSIEQLRAWVYSDDWLRDLSNCGIVLSLYDADEAYLGNSQSVFKKDTAKLLFQTNLKEFFEL